MKNNKVYREELIEELIKALVKELGSGRSREKRIRKVVDKFFVKKF